MPPYGFVLCRRMRRRGIVCRGLCGPVGRIIAAVRTSQLRLGQRNGVSGYRGFCVLKTEINKIRVVEKLPQTNRTTGKTSAAAFGRKVGIRNKGRFLSLVLAGHTPATFEPHPKFGNEHAYVSEVDIAAFHRRFLTPTTMATEFSEHWRTLALKLTNAGVARFGPNGADFGALYLRKDVEAALRKKR